MMSAVLKERRDISGIATQQFSSCSLDSGYVPRGSMHCESERWMAAVEIKLAETWALTVQVKCWKYNILYVAEQQRTLFDAHLFSNYSSSAIQVFRLEDLHFTVILELLWFQKENIVESLALKGIFIQQHVGVADFSLA